LKALLDLSYNFDIAVFAMTLKIIHKNNTSAGQAPAPSDLDVGEIGINGADAELYTKDTSGNIRKFQNTTTGTADGMQFTQAGTGAVQRTVESKLKDVVSVKDFGAVGDGVTDDTTAIQLALNSLDHGYTLDFGNGTYKVNVPTTDRGAALTIPLKNNLTLTNGSFVLVGTQALSDVGSLAAQTLFNTAGIDVGTSLDSLSFVNIKAESQLTDGDNTVADAFLFQSVRGGSTSNYVAGRCDNFKMTSCSTVNMKLCHVFGDGCVISNNSAVSTVTSNQGAARNVAILINQFCSNTSSLTPTVTDVAPSHVIVDSNTIRGFGGGICVHTFFNSAAANRRFITSIVSNNTFVGYTNSEVTANPSLTRGHYGVYHASVVNAICTGNTFENGWDMAVDFEYCGSTTLTGNYIKNGGVKYFWADSNNNLVNSNTFVASDSDYGALISTTGTQATRSKYKIEGNVFRCENPADIDSSYFPVVGISANTYDTDVSDNTFFDCRLDFSDATFHYGTVVESNTFYVSQDLDSASSSILEVAYSGDAYIESNNIDSSVAQTGVTTPMVKLVHNRVNVDGNQDARFLNFQGNSITNSPWSLNLIFSGTAFVNGMLRFVENNYDGSFIHNQSRSDNVIYLHNNYRQDKAGNYRQYAASAPKKAGATPALDYIPEDIACQRGSIIPLYEDAVSGSSGGTSEAVIYGYVCTHIGAPQSSVSPTFSKLSSIV